MKDYKFEADVCNYLENGKGEKYVDRYVCYADFHVRWYRKDTSGNADFLPPIEFFLQPEYDGDGKIIAMTSNDSDDDAELINPDREDEIIEAMQAALDEYEKEA